MHPGHSDSEKRPSKLTKTYFLQTDDGENGPLEDSSFRPQPPYSLLLLATLLLPTSTGPPPMSRHTWLHLRRPGGTAPHPAYEALRPERRGARGDGLLLPPNAAGER